MKLITTLPSLLTRLAAASILFSSCAGVQFDPGPFQHASVTFAVGKVVENSSAEKKEGRIALLRDAAAGIESLATGVPSQAGVDAVLDRVLASDPSLKSIVRALVLGFFPTDPAPEPDPKLSALALQIAADIRAALPPAPSK